MGLSSLKLKTQRERGNNIHSSAKQKRKHEPKKNRQVEAENSIFFNENKKGGLKEPQVERILYHLENA